MLQECVLPNKTSKYIKATTNTALQHSCSDRLSIVLEEATTHSHNSDGAGGAMVKQGCGDGGRGAGWEQSEETIGGETFNPRPGRKPQRRKKMAKGKMLASRGQLYHTGNLTGTTIKKDTPQFKLHQQRDVFGPNHLTQDPSDSQLASKW